MATSAKRHRAPLQPRSVKSSWLYPVRVGQSTPAFEVAVDSNGKQSPLRSSDPGSIALSDGHPDPHATHTLSSGTAPVDDDRWDLRRQINDLIQLEFACQLQRSAPTTRIAPEDQSPDRATEDATQARLSDSSIAPENTEPTSGGAFGPRARYHPFRWSSGAHTGRHGADRSTGAVHPGRTHPRSYASHRPRKAASVMAAETGSVDRLTSSADKRVPIVTEPTTSMTDEPSVLDTRLSPELWSSGPDYGSAVSMWSLNANQLATLRQLSLVQLTSLAEKHCVNRSPFTWRFLKYRGANNSGDSTSPYAGVSPHSHKRPDLHVSGPCVPITTSVCSSSGTETHPANSSTTTASLQQPHTEFQHRTAYEGPVFGQSLESWQRRLGCPLPLAISRMMDHISLVGVSAHGIFRRPGGKVRTQALRQKIESDLCWGDFEDWQPYDVADLLKQFFRELPECLLTDKLSMILINIYSCVSEPTQLSILRWVLFGLPDENRAVLQRLLYLLNGLVRHSDVTQMNESNLAVCFAPSLFRFANSCGASQPSVGLSPRRLRRTTSGPDPKDLADQRTAQQCLASMIRNAPFLFEISIDLLRRAHLFPSPLEPPDLESVFPSSDWPTWLQAELGRLTRECSGGKSRGWTMISRDAWKAFQSGSGAGEVIDSLEVHYRKAVCTNNSKSGSHLRTWRCSLVIPVNDPQTILEKYSTSRAQWDPEVTQMQIVEQISDCVDLCLITHCSIFPQPKRWFHVLRGHQSLLEDGSCALVCESVAPTGSVVGPFGQDFTFGHIYQDHLYIRPRAEEDGCRVYFISKVDVNGHNPDWYVRHWGHTLVRRLLNLRRSFLPAESNQPVERRNHVLLTQPGLSPPSISTNSAVR
ncbi:unnamed protein product [Dicrocoelium dendriticum]|nr:unnamed protein product [Dicrocoelium dendriticum]